MLHAAACASQCHYADLALHSHVPLQICQLLDIPIDEDALRAADGKPNDGTGMEQDGSDEVRAGSYATTRNKKLTA